MTEDMKSSESGLTGIPPQSASALHGQSYQSVRGFAAPVVTQFLRAANDNLLEGVLTCMVIDGS